MENKDRSELEVKRGEYADRLMKQALLDICAEEGGRMETNVRTDAPADIRAEKRARTLMRRMRAYSALRSVCRFVPRAAAAAAALILISGALITGALAVSPGVRVYVTNFIFSIEGSEVRMIAQRGDAGIEVPEGWTGEYFPSYIPEGFVMSGLSDLPSSQQVIYKNDDGMIIILEEAKDAIRFKVDPGEYTVDNVYINGELMERILSDKGMTYMWSYGGRGFCLRYSGDNAAAREIVRSVTRIK